MDWVNDVFETKEHMLASDSLAERIPDLDEIVTKEEESCFICTIVIEDVNGDTQLLSGKTVGVSFEQTGFKIDFRSNIDEAYQFLDSFSERRIECKSFYLRFKHKIIQSDGPFDVHSPRTTDFDSKMKSCTLGLDLLKRKQ